MSLVFYDCNKTHSIVNYFLKSCLGFTVYSESDDLCLQQFWKIIRISLNNVSLPFSLFFPSGTPIRWLLDLLKYMCSVMSNSTRPHGLQPSRLLHPWNFPGKNTGKGCHFLLQEIFSTHGLNLHQEMHKNVSCIGSWVLYHWATWESPIRPHSTLTDWYFYLQIRYYYDLFISQCLFHCLNETISHLLLHIFKSQFYFFSSNLHVYEHGQLVWWYFLFLKAFYIILKDN